VDVNEAYIAQVKADMPCEAVLDAYPGLEDPRPCAGRHPSADRGKATVKVRVRWTRRTSGSCPTWVCGELPGGQAQGAGGAVPGVLLPPEALVQREVRQLRSSW
jgi:hypothetical protein